MKPINYSTPGMNYLTPKLRGLFSKLIETKEAQERRELISQINNTAVEISKTFASIDASIAQMNRTIERM